MGEKTPVPRKNLPQDFHRLIVSGWKDT